MIFLRSPLVAICLYCSEVIGGGGGGGCWPWSIEVNGWCPLTTGPCPFVVIVTTEPFVRPDLFVLETGGSCCAVC